MHEESLVRRLLRDLDALAVRHAATRATLVRLQVGEFSGVDPELIRLAFERLSANTVADRAVLEVRRIPLAARCSTCAKTFPVAGFRFRCPDCPGTEVEIVGGEELLLESVTFDLPE